MEEDFLYKPILEPERRYDSDINFENEEDSGIENNAPEKSLDESIKEVEFALKILPKEIEDPVSEIVSGLKYIISTINPLRETIPSEREKIINIPQTITGPIEDNDYDDDFLVVPDIEDNDYDDDFLVVPDIGERASVIIKPTLKYETIMEKHDALLSLIVDKFIKELEDIVKNYTVSLFSLIGEVKSPHYSFLQSEYKNNTNEVKYTSLAHVSDNIIKSQIKREQQIRLFKKLFNKKGLQKHLRACKIAAKLKERYEIAEYHPNSSLMFVSSNRMLGEARREYERKYNSNFLNLYKYLDSSVKMLDDNLQMKTNENEGKMILVEKTGLDLSQKELITEESLKE